MARGAHPPPGVSSLDWLGSFEVSFVLDFVLGMWLDGKDEEARAELQRTFDNIVWAYGDDDDITQDMRERRLAQRDANTEALASVRKG